MNTIAEELQETKQHIGETATRFTQEQINRVPFEGSWTAAQVTEHLLKSDHGLLEAIHYKVEKTDKGTGREGGDDQIHIPEF